MGNRLYVGNLSYSTTETELADLFSNVAPVLEVRIITDRDTGRSRGFGFVEMVDDEGAQAAIEQCNGQMLGARALRVNEARPRESRPPRQDSW